MAVTEERDLYEVLGLDPYCSPEEIRLAYKKLALQRHPDKLITSRISEEDATAQFQELVHAYEVLFDPKERARYDSRRSGPQVPFSAPSPVGAPFMNFSPFFSKSAFSDFSDTGRGYYKVYSDLFGSVYAAELDFSRKAGLGVREAPPMGNLDSPYAQVTAFYNYWMGFGTVMDFGWVNMFGAAAGMSRRMREEENKMWRQRVRKEYNGMVRLLAEFVKKRDKRVIDMAVKRSMEKKKKKQEMKEKLEKMRAYYDKEAEWEEDLECDDEDEVPGMEMLMIRKRWSNNAWCDRSMMKKDPRKKIIRKPRHWLETDPEFAAISGVFRNVQEHRLCN